ncbi:saccharopine dehydrogenase-like oxidoreductase [Sus scrofa]|uniref:saccharopine dehydrogenase-like oxidoreductase n=1 Tax=Sus scrofa TaxID=9823 RepID=UPI000A2B884C|nr:saccharopine dehydrogenase-like oxidoreductase [Sus scrofa]
MASKGLAVPLLERSAQLRRLKRHCKQRRRRRGRWRPSSGGCAAGGGGAVAAATRQSCGVSGGGGGGWPPCMGHNGGGRPTLPSEVGMIVCAVTNPASLDEMAAQAAVILNCVRPGLCIHDGTWKSAAYDFADKSQLKKLRNESHLKPVPVVGPKLKRRWPVSYCRELNSYSIPFLGADVSVVKRTQCYLHENLEQSPVQYAAYVTMGGITSIIRLMFAGLFFLFFVRFGIGRPLLIKQRKPSTK